MEKCTKNVQTLARSWTSTIQNTSREGKKLPGLTVDNNNMLDNKKETSRNRW